MVAATGLPVLDHERRRSGTSEELFQLGLRIAAIEHAVLPQIRVWRDRIGTRVHSCARTHRIDRRSRGSVLPVPVADVFVDQRARIVACPQRGCSPGKHDHVHGADQRWDGDQAGNNDHPDLVLDLAHRHAGGSTDREREGDPVVPMEQPAGKEGDDGKADPRREQHARSGEPGAADEPDQHADNGHRSQRKDRGGGQSRRDPEAMPVGPARGVDPLESIPDDRVPPRAEADDEAMDEQHDEHRCQPGQHHGALAEHHSPAAFTGQTADEDAQHHGQKAVAAGLLDRYGKSGDHAARVEP